MAIPEDKQIYLQTTGADGKLINFDPNNWYVSTFGRSERNTFVLDPLNVSKYHASVMFLPGDGWRLLDQGSRNGTYWNGKSIGSGLVRLCIGDKIEMGSIKFEVVSRKVVLESETAASSPLLTGEGNKEEQGEEPAPPA